MDYLWTDFSICNMQRSFLVGASIYSRAPIKGHWRRPTAPPAALADRSAADPSVQASGSMPKLWMALHFAGSHQGAWCMYAYLQMQMANATAIATLYSPVSCLCLLHPLAETAARSALLSKLYCTISFI